MKNNFINLTETQKRVLEIIKEQRAYAIFLDMGVGKTALMLSLLEYLMFEKLENINALIILPAQVGKVFQVWQKEIQKWDNFNFIDFILVERKRRQKKKNNIRKKFFYNNHLQQSCRVVSKKFRLFEI